MKKKKSLGSLLLGLLVAGVVWVLKDQGYLANDSELGGWASSAKVPTGEISSGAFTPVQVKGSGWTHLQNCRFIAGRNNDGDSFHVKHEKGETEFRLYFVDTPESQFKSYRDGNTNGPRIAEQGDYFGELDRDATTTVGRAGKDLVKKLLGKNDFEVLTKWEDVYGPQRQYCLVVVPWEGQRVYLHELLVASGLARIHTRGADLPRGRDYRAQKAHLKTIERGARDKKVGAWGL